MKSTTSHRCLFQCKLIQQGELHSTIGDYVTINKPDKGKRIKKHRKYLDKVHMDIVFGDCLSLGKNKIISCFVQFQVVAGGNPKTYHSYFDQKLISGKARRWILESKSRIIAAPANRQSSNGLVECTWQSIVRMARAYITEKQVGREFWYFAIKHTAHMINPLRLSLYMVSSLTPPRGSSCFQLFTLNTNLKRARPNPKHRHRR